MRASKLILLLSLFGLVLGGTSCKKTITQELIVDNYIYDLDSVYLYTSNIEKEKQKTGNQYISILYADLFQSSIPTNVLTDMSTLALSVGDKQVTNTLIINTMVSSGSVIIPTDGSMRADIPVFIEDVYRRFYLRRPTEYEKYFLKNLIEDDASLSPELIYNAFATSNEYLFY